jgi:hypothetical protein
MGAKRRQGRDELTDLESSVERTTSTGLEPRAASISGRREACLDPQLVLARDLSRHWTTSESDRIHSAPLPFLGRGRDAGAGEG